MAIETPAVIEGEIASEIIPGIQGGIAALTVNQILATVAQSYTPLSMNAALPITRGQIPSINITATGLIVFSIGGFSVIGDMAAGSIYTSVGASSAGPMAIQDAGGTWFQLVINGPINVGWCGGSPTGINDTAMIDKAFVIANTYNVPVYFPGYTTVYSYNGAGQNYGVMKVYGDGVNKSVIAVGAGLYLIDMNQQLSYLMFDSLQISGGAGAIRNRWTGVNVGNDKIVTNCYFTQFTGAAISSNASDDPYWKISNNTFYGANGTTAIGVALAGYLDASTIENNDFWDFKIGIKVKYCQRLTFRTNSFLHYSTGTYRADVWVVPPSGFPGSNQNGVGFLDDGSSHGNEFQDPTDFAYLFADEGTGTYIGDRLPVYTQSAGYVSGLTISMAVLLGGTPGKPLVYSTTPNVMNCTIEEVHVGGGVPAYILQYAYPPTADSNYYNNIIGPVRNFAMSPIAFSNAVGIGTYVDPDNLNQDADLNKELQIHTTSDKVDYLNLMTTSITGFTASGVTITTATDADGGSDAAVLDFTASGGYAVHDFAAPTTFLGKPVFISFDIGPPTSGSPLTGAFACSIQETAGFTLVKSWTFPVPTVKTRAFVEWVPKTAGGASNYALVFGYTAMTATGSVNIGRVRVRQGGSPPSGNIHEGPQLLLNVLSPPGTPAAGGYLYVDSSGNLQFKTSAGNTRLVAAV